MLLENVNPVSAQPKARRFKAAQAVAGLLLVALIMATAFYFRSAAFQERVRQKVVAELEQISGGKVEIHSFRWNLSKLEFDIDDLTIHGLESPREVPYLHVDHMKIRLKLLSLGQRQIGLRHLAMDHPVFHLITYANGTTNQPVPRVKQQTYRAPNDQLFDLAIDRTDLNAGWIIWNQRRIPFDFTGNDVSANMTHVNGSEKSYDGRISVGALDLSRPGSAQLRGNMDVNFSLFANSILLKSVKLATRKSHVEASGQIENYAHPLLELTYSASLDLAEIAPATSLRQLHGGLVSLQGQGRYKEGSFSTSGQVFAKHLDLREGSWKIQNLAGGATYALDNKQISLSHIAAGVLGGAVMGDIRIVDWMPAAGKRYLPGGGAKLQIAHMPTRNVIAILTPESQESSGVRILGNTSGSVDATWTGSPAVVEAQAALNFEAPTERHPDDLHPSDLRPNDLRLHGQLRAMYHGKTQTLDVAALNLSAHQTVLTGSGAVGASPQSSLLHVNLRTRDLSDLDPILHLFWSGGELPLTLHGGASFDGVVYGTIASLGVRGHVQATDFETTVRTQPASASPPVAEAISSSQPPTPPGKLHWDSLALDVDYAGSRLTVSKGVLHRATTQIALDGSANILQNKINLDTPFALRLNIRNSGLDDLQSVTGLAYPISGRVDLQLNLSGTRSDLRGGGTVKILGGAIYGEPFREFQANISVAGREAQVTRLVLTQNAAQITGSGAYDLSSKAFHFDVRGDNFDLAQIKQVRFTKSAILMNMTLGGAAGFTAHGSGSVAAPSIDAHLKVSGLVMNGELVGDLAADATTRGDKMQITARSNFKNAQFTADGSIRLRDNFPGSLELRFSQLDVDPFLKMFLPRIQITGHSSMAGAMSIKGPFKEPRQLAGQAQIDQFMANLENVKLQNQGPVRLSVTNQAVRIDQLHLIGDDTEFTGTGTIELAGAQKVDIRSDGFVNLKLLQGWNPDVVSSGASTFHIVASGTIHHPTFGGRVQFQNAAISFLDLPNGLSEINGTLVFNQDRLQVQSLRARTGGGYLDFGGFATYRDGLYFDLTATGHDIRARYPQGVSTSLNTALRIQGTANNSLLSGDVVVTKFGITPAFDFPLYLEKSKQTPTTPSASSIADKIRLDVHITSTSELQVETSLAKLSGDVDVRVRGTAARPAVLGRVNIADGELSFNGTKYHLERGDIGFTNPIRIEPVVNVEASARVKNYDIALGFHGSLDKLSVTYRSEPPLPSADIIALLAFGRTRQEDVANQGTGSSITDSTSNAILGQALTSAVSSRMQKLFGISRVKIDPQLGNNSGDYSTQCSKTCVTIEQQVGNNITVTYVTDVSQSNQPSFQVEYNFNRNISVQASRDHNGVAGLDLRIRQRKR